MDREAFKNFHAQTSRKLWAYLIGLCGDRSLADDILQESYLRFLQKPPEASTFNERQAYLYRIATRLNLDRLKRLKVQRNWLTFKKDDEPEIMASSEHRVAMETDMAAAMRDLRPRERALLWLAYVEEQPHRVIADVLDMKEKSVRVVLYRARKKFAGILTKRGLTLNSRDTETARKKNEANTLSA